MEQQNHTQQHRRMMQHQKHQQAKHYNNSAKNLPSLGTGNVVHIQLVPNVRKWVPRTIIEVTSARSYKVKTRTGVVYVRDRKFIKIRHTDLGQSLMTTQRDITPNENITHMDRPRRITRRPQRLIESMNFIQTRNTQRRFV